MDGDEDGRGHRYGDQGSGLGLRWGRAQGVGRVWGPDGIGWEGWITGGAGAEVCAEWEGPIRHLRVGIWEMVGGMGGTGISGVCRALRAANRIKRSRVWGHLAEGTMQGMEA